MHVFEPHFQVRPISPYIQGRPEKRTPDPFSGVTNGVKKRCKMGQKMTHFGTRGIFGPEPNKLARGGGMHHTLWGQENGSRYTNFRSQNPSKTTNFGSKNPSKQPISGLKSTKNTHLEGAKCTNRRVPNAPIGGCQMHHFE